MTVYSAALHNTTHHPIRAVETSPRLLKLNIAIMMACIAMLVSLVVISNRFVAQRYALTAGQQELHDLSSEVATKEAVMARGQDLENLIALVRQSGMVANSDGQTLFIKANITIAL